MAEPELPQAGSPERERQHRQQRAMLAGLLASGLMRPPAWSDPDSLPPEGAWCGCCGRFGKRGGRWWREVAEPTGWRCARCHPPVHLASGEVAEVVT
jgi:hypothetical protein